MPISKEVIIRPFGFVCFVLTLTVGFSSAEPIHRNHEENSPSKMRPVTYFWDAPSEREIALKQQVATAQITYGLNDINTTRAMWNLASYYMDTEKYRLALAELRALERISSASPTLTPVPLPQLRAKIATATARDRDPQGKARITFGSGLPLVGSNLAFEAYSAPPDKSIPDSPVVGWEIGGSAREKYSVQLDQHNGVGGTKCIQITSTDIDEKPSDFIAFMQRISPKQFAGKRVKLSAQVKLMDAGSAFLILRLDTPTGSILENMASHPITSARDWTPYSIELDVPSNCTTINFGGWFRGPGSAFFDDFDLKAVGNNKDSLKPSLVAGTVSNVPKRPSPEPVGNSRPSPNATRKVEAPSRNTRPIVWQAPTNYEADFKRQIVQCQLQKGLQHQDTISLMWQLAQYYQKLHRYPDALRMFTELKTACAGAKPDSPITPAMVKAAFEETQRLADSALPVAVSQTKTSIGATAPALNLDFEQSGSNGIPIGWYKGGTSVNYYEFGTDLQNGRHQSRCGFVKAKYSSVPEFGTLLQSVRIDKFTGKRVRLSAYIKTIDAGRAGLWMRVDNPDPSLVRMDNMSNRPITGTTDWTKYDCVLDVPNDSVGIVIGVLLAQAGEVLIDDVQVEAVGADVPTTN